MRAIVDSDVASLARAVLCTVRRRIERLTGRLERRETGREQWMKEPYIEGLANHDDPESCDGIRKAVGEALTGECIGEVLSREIHSGVPTFLSEGEGHIEMGGMASRSRTPRGRRPSACADAPCAGTGRSRVRLDDFGGPGRIGKAEAAS